MEVQIKTAIRAGNSSAVILPRSWLNKEVRVELFRKTHETILLEVINLLRKHIDLEEIIGVYLVGSYARGEESDKSDIDILVITKDIDRPLIVEGIYNILPVSSELLKQKLSSDLFPVGQMIREAKPLLNEFYLSSINVKATKKNIDWYIKTTEEKLIIIRKILDKTKKKSASDSIAYTLVLRIRTLYIIEKLILNQDYSKNEFIRIINKVSKGTNAYERYQAVKNNQEDNNKTSVKEIKKLYEYMKEQLIKIKKMIK